MMISFLVAVLFLPVIALGQEQRNDASPDPRKLEWFYADANYRPKTLLLKLLQFTAPFPGHYQNTLIETTGNASTMLIIPNWADRGIRDAKLNDALLAQIKQLLAELKFSSAPPGPEPLKGHLHSVLIFHDGHDFVHVNFNGPVPPQIAAILAILHKEFKATAQARDEEIAAYQKRIRETYGDWENRPGITLNRGGQMHLCKGKRALVIWWAGERKAAGTSSPVISSLYHALIFNPEGAVAGTGNGGRRGFDPVQSYVALWTLPSPSGSYEENTSQRKLEILHNAIDATVTIAGKTYQLTAGNMFVIHMGADWQPTVTQLNEVFAERSTPHATLDRFKAILKDDAAVQKLELY